ncbi:hypothetical protein QN402_32200, partial [Pseudomonas sp. FG1]|nr:hypothetical protein [Pseudomonas sp. FG1]
MVRKTLMLALAGISMLAAVPAKAQGIGHSLFMRGSIVDTGSNVRVVCMGLAFGAEVGQKLEVYRVVTHPGPSKG